MLLYIEMNYFELDCFRYNVLVELSPVELEKHYKEKKTSPFYSNLRDSHFLTLLCEKWKLENVDKFDKFFLAWNKKYLFSTYTTLEYQLENYKKYFTVSKAAGLASRNSCGAFSDAMLKKYPDNIKVNSKIHKNYLNRENALESIATLTAENKYVILPKALRMGFQFKDLFPYENIEEQFSSYRYIITIAEIVFRRNTFNSTRIVGLLDIAMIYKDPKILTDPYYLNHPQVDTQWGTLNIQNCHQLFRHLPKELLTGSFSLNLTKKMCDVLDDVGLSGNAYISYGDEYSFKWMKKNCVKYGYYSPDITIVNSRPNSSVLIQTECDKGFTSDSFVKESQTCPFMKFLTRGSS